MALSKFSFALEFMFALDVKVDIAYAMSHLCRNDIVDPSEEYSEKRIPSAISQIIQGFE